VDNARKRLAELVLEQWHVEAEVRRLDDPAPVAVRWNMTPLDLADHPAHIMGGRGKTAFSGRTDRVGDLARSFRALARRRLVILGEAGMGKTTVAVLLLRELLEHPVEPEPVPVLFAITDFDPATDEIRDWIARKIGSSYPALRADTYGPTAIRELIRARQVLPVLDGLDEMPADIRLQVIGALNTAAADPVILTCRTAEYASAIADVEVLRSAAVIEPDPLSARDIAAFLKACLPPAAAQSGSWAAVLSHLRTHASGPLATALATPFTLWLIRQVYITARADPTPLLDRTRYPTAETIRRHLLDRLIPAVIAANPPSRRSGDTNAHPFRPRRHWEAEYACRWLGYLARAYPSHDLAWWHLRDAATPRSVALTRAVGGGIIVALVAALPLSFSGAPAKGLALGPVLGLTYLLVFGLSTGTGQYTRRPSHLAWILAAGGCSTSLFYWLLAAAVFRIPGALAAAASAGLLSMLPVGLAYWLAGGTEPSQVNLRRRLRETRLSQAVGDTAAQVFANVFLVTGIASVITIWLTRGFDSTGHQQAGNVIVSAAATAAFAAAALATIFVYAAGILQWASSPLPTQTLRNPRNTLRADLRVTSLRVLAVGLPIGGLVGFVNAQERGVRYGVALAMAAGLAFGLMAGLGSQGDIFVLLKLRLWHAGDLPWRLMDFLEDAHRLGLLRQVGPVYQFRHADLQDHLAAHVAGGAGMPSLRTGP
jgi:hypothetical protein